jgi:hypothetical protein
MTVQQLDATSRRTLAHHWEAEAQHGILVAVQIAEARGDEVAQRWFHDHEALPFHHPTECPMQVS